jgi:hypothetical protein
MSANLGMRCANLSALGISEPSHGNTNTAERSYSALGGVVCCLANDHAKQRSDGRLVGGDRIEIAQGPPPMPLQV